MSKIKNIPCDPYRRDIDVFIGSYEELLKYAKKHLKKDPLLDIIEDGGDTDDYSASFYFRGDGTGIIHLFKYPTTPKEIAEAAHEALHTTFHILSYVGVDFKPSGSNEAYAYLHQWILENLLNKKGYQKV